MIQFARAVSPKMVYVCYSSAFLLKILPNIFGHNPTRQAANLTLPRRYDKSWVLARHDVILVRLSIHILDVARVALVLLLVLP